MAVMTTAAKTMSLPAAGTAVVEAAATVVATAAAAAPVALTVGVW